ncbi:MAG: hypothetical protein A2231_04780 [Candidatus Firestonebacteria bacterium RIFOXYA2_FULL_40_8]|nr:MAG: hypothetical protein A2231_04780 [Candidatus Firestonebacteria bacterium RIFOXYA2_FULL_40_8]
MRSGACNTYIAFIRGINVGGKNIIKMESLRLEFEKMGFQSVKTYIQSGNVIFKSELKDTIRIEETIEKALSKAFKYKAKVLVRSKKEMKDTILNFPGIFREPEWKHNIIFLSKKIDSKNILKQLEIKKDIEQTSYCKGVLFWSAKLDKIIRSNMLRLSARPEYKEMTVRNTNTTKKIIELMNG